MGKIVILGSANAVSDEHHDNTHMLLMMGDRNVLIDCGSNPLWRLSKVGIEIEQLTDLIVTHFHPDHISGAPLLMNGMWLLGRRRELHIHGLTYTLDRLKSLFDLYDWKKWPDFFPVIFHQLPNQEMAPVINTNRLRIYSSPVNHLIPTVGLRVEFVQEGKVMAYSCDTEPCAQVLRLSTDVDVLIHEAAGTSKGHSSPAQAAEIARQANAKALYLIHYPALVENKNIWVEEARQVFSRPVVLAEDFLTLEFV